MKTADFSYEKVSCWKGEILVTLKKSSRSPLVYSLHSNLGYIQVTHCDKKLGCLECLKAWDLTYKKKKDALKRIHNNTPKSERKKILIRIKITISSHKVRNTLHKKNTYFCQTLKQDNISLIWLNPPLLSTSF